MIAGWRITLRHRLLFITTLTTGVALVLVAGSLMVNDTRTLKRHLTERLVVIAEVIGSQVTADLDFRGGVTTAEADVQEVLSKLAGLRGIVGACVYHPGTNVFARYPADFTPPPLPTPFLEKQDVHSGTFEVFHPILSGAEKRRTPVGTIFLRANFADVFARTREDLLIAMAVVLISMGIAWLLASRLEPVFSQPIRDLAATSQRISQSKDYSERVSSRRNDELGDLIRSFNEMVGQIQQRDQALQQARVELEDRVAERTRELREEVGIRAHAEADLAQQLRRIQLLNQIIRASLERQDLNSILHVVLGELQAHLPADFVSVHLYDPATNEFSLAVQQSAHRVADGVDEKHGEWRFPLGASGLDEAGTAELVQHSRLDASSGPLFGALARRGLQSAVGVPLRVESSLLGVLVAARKTPNAFSASECRFLVTLGSHTALAEHQIRLRAALQSAYDELRQTQQAVMQQERLRALGQMASGVVHDINNALSPISGFAELLLTSEAGLSENARKHLGYIRTASNDVAHIVARLREFYRGRQEQQPLLPIALDRFLPEIVELTRPRWRDLCQQRGISIAVHLELNSEASTITGVESELREAMTNLIFNAVDAMPQGGTITLRSRTLGSHRAPAAPSGRRYLALEVTDTGIGMDEEVRRRCLDPFFSTKGQSGTGLGLAMVYGTMQRHEGTLEVESAPGKGTTVRLVFPIREATAIEHAAPAAEPLPALPKLRILFVDDEPLLRELIREILECDGHDLTVAEGGASALELFRKARRKRKPFDLVITDLGMPQMDGREFARLLKQESPATPVFMMTGWTQLLQGDEEVHAPVDALVSKPPRIAELNAALHKVLPQSKPAPG